MSDYKSTITLFKHEGVPYTTFINECGDMVIRYNQHGNDYSENIFDGLDNLIRTINVQDNYMHVQGC